MAGPLAIAGLMAGAQLVAGGVNAYAQGRMNRKTIQYNERMYATQRRDALADWAMQNEYNSPKAQMQRYRDAKLNPNLIYGGMEEVSPMRSVNAEGWRPQAADYSFIGDSLQTGFSAYFDLQRRQQELENMKATESLLAQENALKAAQVEAVLQGVSRSKFDLDLAGELRQNSVDMANAQLKRVQADVAMSLDENDRRAAANAVTIAQGVESILTSRLNRAKTDDERRLISQQIQNLKKDAQLKQLDINLKKLGIQPGDALWQRVLGQAVNKVGTLDFNPNNWWNDQERDSTLKRLGLDKSSWQKFLERKKK